MTLRPLSLSDMEAIRQWRNEVPETLRTPFELTAEQQEDWYRNVICDRRSTTRYWGIWNVVDLTGQKREFKEPSYYLFKQGAEADWRLIGYGGIENIQWENRLGEISLLIAPEQRGNGLGAAAVEEILRRAFGRLNLYGVWGECYTCSSAVRFWERQVKKWGGSSVVLPGHRKYWQGNYWPSLYFYFPAVSWVDKAAADYAAYPGREYGNA